MKSITAILFVVAALLLSLTAVATAAPPERASYIVVLHDDDPSPAAAAREIAAGVGGDVGFVYRHAIKGFSITVPPQAVAGLQHNPRVKYVEADQLRYASAQTVPTGIRRIFAPDNANISIDGADDYRVDVDVAVIDTGIDFQHPDLDVDGGVNCTVSILNPTCVAGGDDDHYHGTHVAGTIGALDNGLGVVGVAPGARLWAVKVLNKRGSGWSSWIIAGIDWVANPLNGIEVANMSLGGAGYSQAEYDAIQGAVNKGVAFAVAAGNEDDDANNYSPGGFDNVLSVSALADFNGQPGGDSTPDPTVCNSSDVDDTLADFSNWGPEVDIAAPGVCILSTYPLEKGEYGTISGTSMASPHVAGALALLASATPRPEEPTELADYVYDLYNQVKIAGNFNWTDDSGDLDKEPLLDVLTFTPVMITGGDTNAAPTVSITIPTDGSSFVSGTSIAFAGTATDVEDGTLTSSLEWNSDLDGPIGSGSSFSNTILTVGTHVITASVTDSGGLSGSASVTITVGNTSGITLSVRTYKLRSIKYAELSWNGTKATAVDIKRDGTTIAYAIANEGTYKEQVVKGTTTATYQVCESGTATCSNAVTVFW